jgi:iron complex outermembrane receptor protein
MKNYVILAVFFFSILVSNAQELDTLSNVVVSSSRIELPFKENSRTIHIITAAELKKLGITNVADALQQLAGVDVRRQGINGMQADLYIRGGSFDQTLLLIDGFKVDDPQTGHHTMNLALPIEVIKRIEVVKGPAARVFGQNAFTGAINIITNDNLQNSIVAKIQGGSFGQFIAEVTGAVNLEDSNHVVHFSKQSSEGYRKNTDFDNTNYVLRSKFNKSKLPINLIAAFSERKFGAQNFYGVTRATALPYEVTQASLMGFSTEFKKGNFTFKPRVYWRRNQDEYIFIRTNPSIYRNLHITNKIAGEFNGSYESKLGITGFGLEFSKYMIQSNNLGDAEREIATLFLEHRFELFDKLVDITPGVAVSYFSDFDNRAFPGIDLGVKLSDKIRLYSNVGYTYRVPTYTDLNYSDPSTLGNPNLDAERAFAQELGFKYHATSVDFNMAFFNRNTENFIDYRRATPADLWRPVNIDVETKGFESSMKYNFKWGKIKNQLNIGYTYIDDNIDTNLTSKNGINSMRHQVVFNYDIQLFNGFSQNISYRYVERTSRVSYNVYDLNTTYKTKNIELTMLVQNLFNTDYFENTFVPMPKGNVLFGLKYYFK